MNNRYAGLLTLIALSALAGFDASQADSAPDDGTLVGSRPYSFPVYEEAYGYTRLDGSQDA